MDKYAHLRAKVADKEAYYGSMWDDVRSLLEEVDAPCPSCARLKAENERLRGVLESRHGGEPFALLDEPDAARERAEAMRDVCEAAADCDPSFLTASLRAAISRLAQTKED